MSICLNEKMVALGTQRSVIREVKSIWKASVSAGMITGIAPAPLANTVYSGK